MSEPDRQGLLLRVRELEAEVERLRGEVEEVVRAKRVAWDRLDRAEAERDEWKARCRGLTDPNLGGWTRGATRSPGRSPPRRRGQAVNDERGD